LRLRLEENSHVAINQPRVIAINEQHDFRARRLKFDKAEFEIAMRDYSSKWQTCARFDATTAEADPQRANYTSDGRGAFIKLKRASRNQVTQSFAA